MAAPTYTTDLTTFNLCENSGTFGEFTGMVDGGSPDSTDTDDPIQGTYCTSALCSLKVGELQSIYADYGSGVTIPTDGAILIWNKFDAGGTLNSYASGGVRIVVGTSAAVWSAWKAAGVDTVPYPYGGWYNFAINPTARTRDYNAGTISTYNLAGMAISLAVAGPSKGQPFKIDAIRYGRCTIIIEHGSSGDGYATFTQAAVVNDDNSGTYGYNKWGLFQAVSGGYLWKGRMQIGTTTNACEFDDSDALIFIDDTVNCTAYFNTIEVNNASTIVNWTNVIFKALGTTSPGRLVMNHNADMNIDACQFFDMGDFGFGGSGSEFLNSVFQGCGQITVNGGKLNGSQITGCTVDGSSSDEAAIIWDVNVDPDGYLDGITVTKGSATNHAIEFGDTVPSSLTLRNCTFSGYNASDSNYDSTFYFADTSGTITLNLVGCSGNVSIKTAGCTVTKVEDPVTVKATVKTSAGVVVQSARVFVAASNGTGPFPFEESVTIANSGTTATVTHSTHGMATNDYVVIKGASLTANNGVFQITVSDASTYTYTMLSTPGSSPSGTITATFVALYGLTDVNGIVSTSRVYSSNQPVVGWARKSSVAGSLYKPGPISEEVDSSDGMNTTAILISDE